MESLATPHLPEVHRERRSGSSEFSEYLASHRIFGCDSHHGLALVGVELLYSFCLLDCQLERGSVMKKLILVFILIFVLSPTLFATTIDGSKDSAYKEYWNLLIPALVVVIGWGVVDLLSKARDVRNKKREIISIYLIEAYRNIEDGCGRDESFTNARKRKMEKAIADIQLFGSKSEVEAAKKFTDNMNSNQSGDPRDVLILLRTNLRRELKLEPASEDPEDIIHWRIK